MTIEAFSSEYLRACISEVQGHEAESINFYFERLSLTRFRIVYASVHSLVVSVFPKRRIALQASSNKRTDVQVPPATQSSKWVQIVGVRAQRVFHLSLV